MTRTRTMITTACGATVAAGAVVALAMTGTASASTPPTTGTFTLTAHNGSEANIDLGRRGFGAGDEDLIVSSLTYKRQPVGRLVGNCTAVRVGRTSADSLCEFVLHLGASQLTASGTVRAGRNGPGTFTLPILGGTGRYRSAGGIIAVTATNTSTVPISVSVDS